ncbi:MAG: aromatic amino acid efflux DMT transporter YddG, partial [Planctomycetaceae bacterium]
MKFSWKRSLSQGNVNISWSTGGGLVAIVLWSTTVAVARSLSEQTGPLTAGAYVYLIGGLLCLLQLGWRRAPMRRFLTLSRRYVFGCGSLFVLYTVLLFLAVGSAADRQQVLEIGLVNYLWPAATILFSLLLLHKRASLLLVPGTALALAGEFLVITQGTRVSWQSFWGHLQVNPAAYAFAFVGAVTWALYSTLARRWSRPGAGGAVELFIPATGLALLGLRFFSTESFAWSARVAGEAVVLGVCTVLAYSLWDAAMRKGHLSLVVACSYFTPLLSTLVSCLYLKVTPGLGLWVGSLTLVIGSF